MEPSPRTLTPALTPASVDCDCSCTPDCNCVCCSEHESLRIAAIAFESQVGIFVTNAGGTILRANPAFTQITGYTEQEVLGQNPRLLNSGRHDASFYRQIWAHIQTQGVWAGEIWNRRKNGEVYPEWLTITAVPDAAGNTTHYVANFSDISARKNAEERIAHLAFYDPLTGLPNRRLLMDRLGPALATALRRKRLGALLFVDLDRFKTINDTLGHHHGDMLLEQVAQRLRACVREGDTVARLGGDEFVVMLEDLSENDQDATAQAHAIAQKMLAAFATHYQLGEHACSSTPSIGVTLFGGTHAQSMETAMQRADMAMYRAKSDGRNTIRFTDSKG